MTSPLASPARRNALAALLMAGATLFAVFIPIALLLGDAPAAPFLFNGIWRLGAAAAAFLFVLLAFPGLAGSGPVWRVILTALPSGLFLAGLLNTLEFALLTLAAWAGDISLALTLQQVYPLLVTLLLAALFRGEGRYRRNLRRLLPCFLVSAAGAGLALAGWSGGFGAFLSLSPAAWLGGAILALLSAAAAACGAFSLAWGLLVARRLAGRPETAAVLSSKKKGKFRLGPEVFGMAVALALLSLAGAGGSLLFGLSFGPGWAAVEAGSLDAAFGGGPAAFALTALLGGFVLHAGNGLCFRVANAVAENLAVNVLVYAALPLSLLLLALLGLTAVGHWPLFLLGAGLILAGGLGANGELLAVLGRGISGRLGRRGLPGRV